MSIFVNKDSKILIQGITGASGSFHGQRMVDAGTNVLAGTNPGKGGDWTFGGKVPVFDTVQAAVEMTGVDTSVIFVPGQYAVGAIYEAVDAGIELVVCVSKDIPVNDMLHVRAYLKKTNTTLIGPGAAGICAVDVCNVGVIHPGIISRGNVGIVSTSQTLTYEVLQEMKDNSFGASSIVELGNGPVFGTSIKDVLLKFEADPDTGYMIMLGEVGVTVEDFPDLFATTHLTKPIFSYLSDSLVKAPDYGGYAGMILNGNRGSYESMQFAWHRASIFPYPNITDLVLALRQYM